MNRSGYNEYDGDSQWSWICWRGAVASAIRGKRGQAFLKELLDTLDAMPEKKLIGQELVTPSGEVCAIGSVMVNRGIDASKVEVNDYESIAEILGISQALVREIEYINDEAAYYDSPQEKAQARFKAVRDWVEKQLKEKA